MSQDPDIYQHFHRVATVPPPSPWIGYLNLIQVRRSFDNNIWMPWAIVGAPWCACTCVHANLYYISLYTTLAAIGQAQVVVVAGETRAVTRRASKISTIYRHELERASELTPTLSPWDPARYRSTDLSPIRCPAMRLRFNHSRFVRARLTIAAGPSFACFSFRRIDKLLSTVFEIKEKLNWKSSFLN